MNISSIHANEFSAATKIRGTSYCTENKVQITKDEPSTLRSIVRGSKKYLVEFSIYESKGLTDLFVCCSCSNSEAGDFCQHIWATIVHIESRKTTFKINTKAHCLVHLIQEECEDDYEYEYEYECVDDDDEDEEEKENLFSESTPIDPLDLEYDHFNNCFNLPDKENLLQNQDSWQENLSFISNSAKTNTSDSQEKEGSLQKTREIIYYLDLEQIIAQQSLVIGFQYREQKKNGDWGVLKALKSSNRSTFYSSNDEVDREIYDFLADICDFSQDRRYFDYYSYYSRSHQGKYVTLDIPQLWEMTLSRLAKTQRLFLSSYNKNVLRVDLENPISWENGEAWQLKIQVKKDTSKKIFLVSGSLFKGETERSLKDARVILNDLIIFSNSVAKFTGKEFLPWVHVLKNAPMQVPFSQQDELFTKIFALPLLPKIDLPQELEWEKVSHEPRIEFNIYLNESESKSKSKSKGKMLSGKLVYYYGETSFSPNASDKDFIVDKKNKKLIHRNKIFEKEANIYLRELGLVPNRSSNSWILPENIMPKIVISMIKKGWKVKAEGKKLKASGSVSGTIKSGIDWFDLSAEVDFDGYSVSFPSLLEAVKNNESMILLGDGSYGLLAKEWLEKYSQMLELGKKHGKKLRFRRSQVSILDAMLDNKPEIESDKVLANLQDGFKKLRSIKPAKETANFTGSLRGYQREGLGWLKFLHEFHFGGCLADDMGLGKTVQVIALLDWNYSTKQRKKPSIVVVPRSLIYNWKLETGRFSKLKVLDYSGASRRKDWKNLKDYQIVLTTYAILRSDIEDFAIFDFEYAILDEAQAIKNASSQIAKASKLLRARHKLAMSGTPIENHVGELWSLFEFINPGFMNVSNLKKFSDSSKNNENSASLLARAISPFVLRRTKEKVLQDLPPKSEQIVYCELNSVQKKKYDELKKYYRLNLDSKIKEKGLKKVQMHVLEALLRLRQTACHHGLVDAKFEKRHSAKTEVIMEQIGDVLARGHKVLIFSQFTKMLAIVRNFIEKEKIDYEYLDGKTRNRQERVDRFQTDKNCAIFLISLKAGGLGLNLTAADYCFILDPWWNPAVEAQAVDRMHRIGQKKKVFAYRYIARGTVEEKILQLQASKKSLSEGLITADSSLMKGLTQKDLDFLLA